MVHKNEYDTSAKEADEMNVRKAANKKFLYKIWQVTDIVARILKLIAKLFVNSICLHFNQYVDIDEFPHEYKCADSELVHGKSDKCGRTNYRHVRFDLNVG